MARLGLHIEIRGTVQGVGYRPWVYQLARRIGIGGRVWNHSRGVSVEAHGSDASLGSFVVALRAEAPPAARVSSVVCTEIAYEDRPVFGRGESSPPSEHRSPTPADLATCDE